MSLLEVAQEITGYIIKDLGDQAKLVLVYGSAASGEATQFSDLDMLIITDSASYSRSFILKGRPVEIWSMTLAECKKLVTTPSISWGVAIAMFFQNKVLYGDQRIVDHLRHLYDSLDMQPFIQNCANTLVYFVEILGKVKSAAEGRDLIYARYASFDLANTAAGIVAMINKKYFLNQWGKHLPEILTCKILPEDFEQHYRTLWLSSDFNELIASINHLYQEFDRILQKLGAKTPCISSLEEAMQSR